MPGANVVQPPQQKDGMMRVKVDGRRSKIVDGREGTDDSKLGEGSWDDR